MRDSIDLRNILKFNETNFQTWKFQMKAVFIANGLSNKHRWKHKKITEWKYKWMGQEQRLDDGHHFFNRGILAARDLTCETAADVWKRLSVVQKSEQKSESNKLLWQSFIITK